MINFPDRKIKHCDTCHSLGYDCRDKEHLCCMWTTYTSQEQSYFHKKFEVSENATNKTEPEHI